MEKSLKSAAINFGLYLGLALSGFTIISYAINLGLLVNYWIMILILPLSIIVYGVFATAKIKSHFDGFLSFKETFSAYFITVSIGIIISTLISVLLFNYIDTNAAEEIKRILIANTENFMRGMGAPLETISKNIDNIENQNTFSIGVQIKSLAQSLIFFSVIGLIVAAALKKNKPKAE